MGVLWPPLRRKTKTTEATRALKATYLNVLPAIRTLVCVRMTSEERKLRLHHHGSHMNVANIWISHVRVEDL